MNTTAKLSNARVFRAGPWCLVTTLLTALLGVFLLASTMGMAPEPDPIPRRWQLTIEPGPLRVMTVDVKDEGEKAYFYFTYKVINSTGGDLLFAPSFDMVTDTGEVQRSGRDVPASVTKSILDGLSNKGLEDQISIVGTLLQGEGNAKEGLVIWPASALRLDTLEVYAAGFSGENKSVEIQDPKTGKASKATVRKTLQMRFQSPGEIRNQGSKPFEMIEQRWVMR